MCITYEVGAALYVNVTNRCTNRCDFCIRNNGDGAYGSDSLWLTREPTAEEIISAVTASLADKHTELVFCGYGEPSIRLPAIKEAVLALRKKGVTVPVRINTNGHSDLIFGTDSTEYYRGVFDAVSISLNAPTPEKYEEICHPVYKEITLDAILLFAKNVKKCVPNTYFSVVRQTISDSELAQCKKIASELGIPLRVREYISD